MVNQTEETKEYLSNLIPSTSVTTDDARFFLEATNDEERPYINGMINEFKDLMKKYKDISFKDFIHGIKFMTYLNSGDNITSAYKKTFGYTSYVQELIQANKLGEIRAAASAFSKSKIVVMLSQEMDYPLDILYLSYKHQAVEVLREEMYNAKSSRDKVAAANALLTHVAPKVQQNVNLTFNKTDTKTQIDIYRDALKTLASDQRAMIKEQPTKINEIINVDITE